MTTAAMQSGWWVLRNRNGFWALVYIVKVYIRQALNRELVIEFRYVIQPNRTPDFSGFPFPGMDAEGTEQCREGPPAGSSVHCDSTALLRHWAPGKRHAPPATGRKNRLYLVF
jgi:hypothetical protein